MNKLIKEIMELLQCTETQASTIINTTIQTSNLVHRSIQAVIKKEYDIR